MDSDASTDSRGVATVMIPVIARVRTGVWLDHAKARGGEWIEEVASATRRGLDELGVLGDG